MRAAASNSSSTRRVQCATCHTLADAEVEGNARPEPRRRVRVRPRRRASTSRRSRDVVRGQIAYPEEPMPANLAEGQDADDISVYIAKCSGNAALRRHRRARERCPGRRHDHDGARAAAAAKPDGKAVFASAGCGGCHTLKDAGVDGQRRPEPRPAEAVRADGASSRSERRRRDAAVQGSADGCADQGRRRVRRAPVAGK